MQNKWLSSWRGQDNSSEAGNSATKPAGEVRTRSAADHRSATPRIDLPAFEEIYRAAGIKGSGQGYTIEKVIEMLQSEHIKNLPAETRRLSLLMALDAAGVQVDEVLHDASLRQHALTTHETAQHKRLEEFEARKEQENAAIHAEAERVAADYAARISRNHDEVARERESFRQWQAKKQQEAQRIVAAVSLCFSQGGNPVRDGKLSADRMAAFRELATTYNDPDFVNRS